MLLDNEDKISVSITSSWHASPMLACITCPFSPVNMLFMTCLLISWVLFVFFQIDRVVEELENRPELQHVVNISILCCFQVELNKPFAGHIFYGCGYPVKVHVTLKFHKSSEPEWLLLLIHFLTWP